MKFQNILSRILDGLILLVFILFFASAGFQDKSTSGWYQQFFPNLNGSTIQSMTFLDSLTGFAVTNTNSSVQAYILKTTNGGDNWSIVHTYTPPATTVIFTKIQFADSITGFASTNYYDFFKTTNNGQTWTNYPNVPYGAADMSALNKDTIFVVSSLGLGGGVYRSTNGGINWQYLWTSGSNGNPDNIYMFDKNLGFATDGSYNMRRTTNGGFNWDFVPGEFYISIKFFDSNTGWKTYGGIQKTTNGGLNWFIQQLPNISNSYSNSNLDIVSKDTVWMVGAEKWHKAPIYKTTNGGLNWGYQIPDTTYPISSYDKIQFVDSKHGWIFSLYGTNNLLYHTKVGGDDTTYITNINSNVNVELSDYHLFQNYPNPFNNSTIINYQLSMTNYVIIKIFNINGREVSTLVNEKKNTGNYAITFNGNNLPSGIYFYSLIIDGKIADTKRMIMIK